MYSVVVFSPYVMHYVGTKNVAKELAKITKGSMKDRDKTWFTELADKRKLQVCTTCMYV